MPVIATVEDGIKYAQRLGFGTPRKYRTPGWIPRDQLTLCLEFDKMLAASGQDIFQFRPFQVRYTRATDTYSAVVVK